MKSIVGSAAVVIFAAALITGCGNSGSKKATKEETMSTKEHESMMIKAVSARVAVLDSMISVYNQTVNEDQQLELFSFDSNYLKMFHGDKFEEKLNALVSELDTKEASVFTSIRATKIMATKN